ncbi:hypothetical protein [Scytonema sp. NUACC21]
MRLKRWESPRREGRNDKGRGGSARQRQLKKQQQTLRKKLKEGNKPDKEKPDNCKNRRKGEDNLIFLFFCPFFQKNQVFYLKTRDSQS